MTETEDNNRGYLEEESGGLSRSMSVLRSDSEKNGQEISKVEIVRQLEKRKEKQKDLDPTRYGDWEKNGRCIDF